LGGTDVAGVALITSETTVGGGSGLVHFRREAGSPAASVISVSAAGVRITPGFRETAGGGAGTA
jgi:hypothetical protein